MKRDADPHLLAPAATTRTAVTVAHGDGIGPEIMAATLRVLDAAGARIEPEFIEVGESVYRAGHTSGIAPPAWESLRRTRVFLKGPITTPSGGGCKSLNVTIRKTRGLDANVRPCASYAPYVPTRHPGMDVVIVRENEEDLYAGIEHRQTDDVYQCLKLISRPGCERIARHAFEYALAHGRRKVTCMVKDNIMKMTDGLFWDVFQAIGAEYPQLEKDRLIVDIGAARLATRPGDFDVVVLPNLYGDILSDVAAELTGSVGLAPSANVGDHMAMFEAIHGSAPDLAGRDVANPSGLLLSAVMMLVHIGQPEEAARIHNAWLRTLEDGMVTQDLRPGRTAWLALGTRAFADAVIARLGQLPQDLPAVRYDRPPALRTATAAAPRARARKELVGVDAFLHASAASPEQLGQAVAALAVEPLSLRMVTNRGVKVWPGGVPETLCTDHWRCRFQARDGAAIAAPQVLQQLSALVAAGLDVIKTENLYTFDGQPGFALGQGQ